MKHETIYLQRLEDFITIYNRDRYFKYKLIITNEKLLIDIIEILVQSNSHLKVEYPFEFSLHEMEQRGITVVALWPDGWACSCV